MGISDFFARRRVESEKKALMKNIRRLIHQDLQHEDRLRAAEYLSEVGTTEALYGLLRRYDMTLDKGYMDQDEKSFVHDVLVSKGQEAVAPIQRFLLATENVSWPERILSSILQDDDKVVGILLEVLRKELEDGSDMRASKRANLLELFKAYQDPRIAEAVVPFLEDYDEHVRIAAVEILDVQGEDASAMPLARLLVSEDEDSNRVRRRILEVFINQGWAIPGESLEAAKPLIPAELQLQSDGRLQARG